MGYKSAVRPSRFFLLSVLLSITNWENTEDNHSSRIVPDFFPQEQSPLAVRYTSLAFDQLSFHGSTGLLRCCYYLISLSRQKPVQT